MPHDLRWPRYDDDDTFVQIGDWVISNSGQKCGEAFKVNKVWFENGTAHMSDRVTDGHYWHYKKKDPYVKRALLDHEGKPLYKGNLAWSIYTGERAEVLSYIGKCVYVLWENGVHDKVVPCCFTSIKPAFDCDGKLIKVGETVWHEDGTELRVLGFGDEEDGETIVSVEYVSGPTIWGEVRSLSLTHTKPEPPDSLERIADDIDRLREEVALYLGDYLYDDNVNGSIQLSMKRVAKRCRALAELERGK